VKAELQTICEGGDRGRAKLGSLAFLVPPHFAVAAYLEPNSQSLQKPIGGRSVLALSTTKSMLKNLAYLEPVIAEPIEGSHTQSRSVQNYTWLFVIKKIGKK
jgi:hypothetical protein